MNFLDQLKSQILAGLTPLGAQLGAGEAATRAGVNAGVPALVTALSGLAADNQGAQKLLSAFGRFDATGGPPTDVIERGNDALNTLFNSAVVSGVANALSRFTGLSTASAQKLLAYLTPFVLASVASRFAGRQPTTQELSSFFNEQKASIANALPAGFTLADIPGMPNVSSALRPAGDGASLQSAPSPGRVFTGDTSPARRWLIPALAAVAVVAVLFFVYRGPTLSVPSPEKFNTDLNAACQSLSGTVNDIKDAATAESAVQEVQRQVKALDELKGQLKRMPEADRARLMSAAKANLVKMEEQYARLVWVPGAGEKVRKAMDDAMTQLAAMSGEPVPSSPAVSGEIAAAVTAVTEALEGIKDGPSATVALTKLKEADGKLQEVRAAFARLGEPARAAIAGMVKPAVEKLRRTADRATAAPGAGEKIRPVVESILTQLNGLTA